VYISRRESGALDEGSRVMVSAGEGGALRTHHRAHAAVVECIQPLAERRCQHPVLASVEQQLEHEGATQLAFGHERERAGAEALAT
jgi:hypothetical protein